MHCPRLGHYARLNSNGTIGCCGHMVNGNQYDTFRQLENSAWLEYLRYQMRNDQWPKECKRCQQTEELNGTSIRLNSIERDSILSKFDKRYIQLGGTLDNYCNSACITCKPSLSTRIGNLKGKLVVKDNYELYKTLPLERVVEIDINGGEPSISENYNDLLNNLPDTVKIIRINTNCARPIRQLETLLNTGITVIVTVSFDGIGKIHDYIRYPVKWSKFEPLLLEYKNLSDTYANMKLDTWTTVSALNVAYLKEIQTYCADKQIRHQFAFLNEPDPLNVKYTNWFTKDVKLEGVATDKDNTDIIENFLQAEESIRQGIERFW